MSPRASGGSAAAMPREGLKRRGEGEENVRCERAEHAEEEDALGAEALRELTIDELAYRVPDLERREHDAHLDRADPEIALDRRAHRANVDPAQVEAAVGHPQHDQRSPLCARELARQTRH